MNIIATADLHGHLPDIPPCDLLLLAGDILPEEKQDLWTLQELRPWVRSLRARRILFIGGNHDFYFQTEAWRNGQFGAEYFHEIGATYLQDSSVQIGSLSVWGTPWVEGLPDGWAFNREDAREVFARIPEGTDIVLSHSPPKGILDECFDTNAGSSSLAARLQRVAPRCSVFGHIHERAGSKKEIGATRFYNVSHMNEKFVPTEPPAAIEIGE